MSLLKRTLLVLLSLSGVFLVSCGGTFLIIISNLNLGNGSRSTVQIGEIIGTIAGIILLIFSVYLAFLTFKKFIGPAFAYFCLGLFGIISTFYGLLMLYQSLRDFESIGILIATSLLLLGGYSLWKTTIYKKGKKKDSSPENIETTI